MWLQKMIDLKRNSKKVPIEATGIRSRKSSLYKPNQKEDFKIRKVDSRIF